MSAPGTDYIIPWPDIDEDLDTEALLAGAPAPRGSVPDHDPAAAKAE